MKHITVLSLLALNLVALPFASADPTVVPLGSLFQNLPSFVMSKGNLSSNARLSELDFYGKIHLGFLDNRDCNFTIQIYSDPLQNVDIGMEYSASLGEQLDNQGNHDPISIATNKQQTASLAASSGGGSNVLSMVTGNTTFSFVEDSGGNLSITTQDSNGKTICNNVSGTFAQ